MSSAEKYNSGKAGKLWDWAELPPHMRDHRATPSAFAKRVRVFQAQRGLVADGKLGPKTLDAIRLLWPALTAPAPIHAPAPAAKKAKTKADKPKKAEEPDGVVEVDGKTEPVPLS